MVFVIVLSSKGERVYKVVGLDTQYTMHMTQWEKVHSLKHLYLTAQKRMHFVSLLGKIQDSQS